MRQSLLVLTLLGLLCLPAAAEVPLPEEPDWEWFDDQQWAYGGLAFGDADADGFLDLVVGTYNGSNWYPPIPEYHNMIFLNEFFGLPDAASWSAVVERHCSEVVTGEVTADGVPDVFFANGGTGYDPCTVYAGDPAGPGDAPDWNSNASAWAVGAALGDVDGDGYTDAVTANQGRNQYDPTRPVYLFWGGEGGLQSTPGWQSSQSEASQSIALGDLDNSHLQTATAVFTGDGVSQVFWLPHAPLTAVDEVRLDGDPFELNYCYDPAAGWFSPDGAVADGQILEVDYSYSTRLDVVVAKWTGYDTCVYYNTSGTPETSPGWSSGRADSGDEKVLLLDYDADGDLDLLVAADSLRLYENDGGLGGAPVWETADDLYTNDALCGDLNGDGYPELILANGTWKGVDVYENMGGYYNDSPDWSYTGPEQTRAIALGDVDCNGALDLAAGFSREPLALFLNTEPSMDTSGVELRTRVVDDGVLVGWTIADGAPATLRILRGADRPVPVSGALSGSRTAYLDRDVQPGGQYVYWLEVTGENGASHRFGPTESVVVDAGAGDLRLEAPWPNPASNRLSVIFELPTAQHVELAVYDLSGRRVATLTAGELAAGRHEVAWDCAGAATGVYLLRLVAAEGSLSRRVVVGR
jgi:hypothetical protein